MGTASNSDLFDFVGIKKGDVVPSCTSCSTNGVEARKKTEISFIETPDFTINSEENIEIPFFFNDFKEQIGFGLAITFSISDMEFLEFNVLFDIDGFGTENFGLSNVQNGEIRVVWLQDKMIPTAFDQKTPLFSLKMKPSKSALGKHLSHVLDFEKSKFENASYNTDLVKSILKLKFTGTNQPKDLEVNVFPNPFTHSLTFEILSMVEMGIGEIEIYDSYGKLISATAVSIENGSAQILIDEVRTFSDGMYFYKISINGDTSYGKISKIK